MQSNAAASGDTELVVNGLGPLAWVLDELRKSLDGATKAIRRFVHEAELARGSDLEALDASQLRQARQQLHQAVGALEMVGLGAPAKVLRAMEALAQKFVQRPEFCSDDAAAKVERASFALTEYLEGVLKGKMASSVALFPQYRDVLELVGGDRVHPADLWSSEWRWIDTALPVKVKPLACDSAVRARMDQAVLKVVKTGNATSAKALRDICLGFSANQPVLEPRVFWKICAAFFEALALKLCPADIYVKRAASRVLLQYTSLARGDQGVSDRLAQDFLFFCAQAVPAESSEAPVLSAVRHAYGLTGARPVDYETVQFGRFDPALLVQARKRIATATETWSALAGGDINRLKVAADHFGAVSDSILKLHPENGELARALTRAIEATVQSAEPPTTPVAMEVATAILYLEAAYEELDPADSSMIERSLRLAQRLDHVRTGGQPEALEGWMEELYRRVSDRQTMGSVVEELRTTLGEIEKSLDQFFRSPQDKAPLHEVPGKLVQMRGVFSVLGLDQASLAVLRMRDSVEKFLADKLDEETDRAGIFEKFGNSLGALGFLIDMLSYQRALAKKLFVYDEVQGEFKPLMGREKAQVDQRKPQAGVVESPPQQKVSGVDHTASMVSPAVPALTQTPANGPEPADDGEELRGIFLEEAREVIQKGLEAIKSLAADPSDLGRQTTLRRAFHTLKGGSRMVGLHEFGEAAWSWEQLLNTWLAEQKPASDELVSLSSEAMHGFGRWLEDIAAGNDVPWNSQAFRKVADGLRIDNKLVPLLLPGTSGTTEVPASAATAELEPASVNGPQADAGIPGASATTDLPVIDFENIDFGNLVSVSAPELTRPAASDESPGGPELLPSVAAEADTQDQVKVIGSLRIGIPLYNVYLNEADEWSRRLLTELSEWALELHRPISDSTVALAHSLAGSSATVGFHALSDIARALEQALQHVQLHAQGIPEHARVFSGAAEDIRHLLHQFAAGFLKEPDRQLLQELKDILEMEFTATGPGDAVVEEKGSSADQERAERDLLLDLVPVASERRVADRHRGAAQILVEEHDDIDVLDAIDVDLFPIFEEEATELLPQLGGALRQWLARPDNRGARVEVLRVLHTLKGSARLAGAMRLGEMAHRMESAIEQIATEFVQASQLEPLLTRFDGLQENFNALCATPVQADMPEQGQPLEAAEQAPAGQRGPSAPAHSVLAAPVTSALAPLRQTAHQSVRVRSQLLDRLVNQAGEVMIIRSRLDARLGQLRGSLNELTGNLDRLRHHLRDIEAQAEFQMQSHLAQVKDTAQGFDPLEFDRFTRVQELTRMMAESVNDVATVQRNLQRTVEGTEDDLMAQARQARELQRDLLRTRMVEFDGISDRLYGVVRQAAKDTGKQVKLDITGGSLDMDRGVLVRMAPAFEHMLRNAVAHGIEDPAVRERAGKPSAGTITIGLHQESNDVSVVFSDDGAGLDLPRIRQKAVSSGLVPAGTVLSDADAANIIFMPGFSTAAQVTELAGRGIGMDVVLAEVNALGGRIETSTEPGKGTRFKLVLPLTTAVTQVVMLRMGDLTIGVPANLVEIVRRATAAELEQACQHQVFEYAGEQVPFFWAGALLQASSRSHEAQTKTMPVVIFRSAGQRIAAHVDEVLGNQEVVVKNLGPQLSRLPGLAGMSVLASGAVVLIYNPVALASVYGDKARELSLVGGGGGCRR